MVKRKLKIKDFFSRLSFWKRNDPRSQDKIKNKTQEKPDGSSASEDRKKFREMSQKQKKNFLSNDLSERIIRVEQRVSTKFGKLIPYNKTEYYQHMDKEEKKKFDEYLKNKGKKEIFVSAVLLGLILALGFFNFSSVGNAVLENFPESAVKINFLFASVFIIFILGLVIGFLARLKRKMKYREHIKVIDNIIFGKSK